MIGGFLMRADVCEHGRRSVERGVAALGGAVAEANFAAAAGAADAENPAQLALDALGHAVAVSPAVAGPAREATVWVFEPFDRPLGPRTFR